MAVGNSKKELVVQHVKGNSFWEIVYTGGGVIPKELQGVYTKESLADSAIENYKKNSKSNGKSTAK